MSTLQTNAEKLAQFNHSTGYNMSSKYKAINTAEVIAKFEAAGFVLNRVSAAGTRKKEKQGYQKHLLTFRHPDIKLKNVNDAVPEILLKNSYDGSCAYVLCFGVYRMVCANGLVVGQSYQSARVIHVGQNAISTAIAKAFEIASQAVDIAKVIGKMQSIQLNYDQQYALASMALKLILPEHAINYSTNQLLKPRRDADFGNDLWSVYNRVQENIVRGGFKYRCVQKNGRVRNSTKRAIKAVDASLSINSQLWDIAEHFLAKVG